MNFSNKKNKKLVSELEMFCEVKTNVDLTSYNTFKVFSICDILISPKTKESLCKSIKILEKYNKKYIILGNGSNVIFKKERIKKVIILLDKLNEIVYDQCAVTVGAGVLLSTLVKNTLEKELVGLEYFMGIPGTVGGSVYGNAGSYGKEISEQILNVEILKNNEIITLNKNDMYFSYRDSIFKKEKNMIILSVTFGLSYGDKEKALEFIKEKALARKNSQPLEYPSAGSVFRNPTGNYAGALIEEMGFKGFSIGDAKVSEKHANFIVNTGKARGKDIIKLIKIIKKKAKKQYKIDLILEHIIID